VSQFPSWLHVASILITFGYHFGGFSGMGGISENDGFAVVKNYFLGSGRSRFNVFGCVFHACIVDLTFWYLLTTFVILAGHGKPKVTQMATIRLVNRWSFEPEIPKQQLLGSCGEPAWHHMAL
jgi:hypothetical protein